MFSRGKVSNAIQELVQNLRKLFSPNTAHNLKVKKSNKMKDLINIAGPLGVTHFLIFSQTDVGTNLRMVRAPHGPTMTFRLVEYSLNRDIINFQKRPEDVQSGMQNSPLVVLNNFGDEDEGTSLMAAMIQNMFPPLSVKTIKLSECARVTLWNYSDELIDMRHYRVKASPIGLDRNIKRVIKGKRIPNLAKYRDITDYVDDNGFVTSDSEAEDTEENRMVLPQDFRGKGNKARQKSAIRLKEIGPRLTLKLLKIEEGVNTGAVLYHRFETKTEAEIQELRRRKNEEKTLKRKRKEEQEQNVENKKAAKRMKKQKRKERWMARQRELDEDA